MAMVRVAQVQMCRYSDHLEVGDAMRLRQESLARTRHKETDSQHACYMSRCALFANTTTPIGCSIDPCSNTTRSCPHHEEHAKIHRRACCKCLSMDILQHITSTSAAYTVYALYTPNVSYIWTNMSMLNWMDARRLGGGALTTGAPQNCSRVVCPPRPRSVIHGLFLILATELRRPASPQRN